MCSVICWLVLLSGGGSSVEALPNWLLHSRYGPDETLPLEAACATETVAQKRSFFFFEAQILCQSLNGGGW